MPLSPPLAVVVYGPVKLQRLAPLAEQYRSLPHACLVRVVIRLAAVLAALKESSARRP
jgi:hypothetical protein